MISKTSGEQPRAVIIGLESMQGLQAARILADRGVPVVAVADDERHFCCRTRSCERIVFIRNGLMNTLKNLGGELPQRAVLFPCTDESVLLVSRNRDLLRKYYHIVLPEQEVVESMMDKSKFYILAQKYGFNIPDTFFIHNNEDLSAHSDRFRYPCIFKPHFRDALWGEGTAFKAFKVNNFEELSVLFDKLKELSPCFIVQDWIEGPDANLFSCNCYFNGDSQPLVTFVARKIRQWPPEIGQSSSGIECRDDYVLGETLRLFRSVGFRGLGYLEMKRDARTGRYFVIEPNIGRPTGRSAIAEAGGVELLYTMYCDALGWPLPARREQKYEGVKWIHLRRDFQAAFYYWRKGELTVREWGRSWRGKKAFALFSRKDPGPFLQDLRRAVRLFCNKNERRKRDVHKPLLWIKRRTS